MGETVESKVLAKIKKARRGTPFFVDSFASVASARSVNKALERLVKAGQLLRVATGIYVRPEKDAVLGLVTPDIETIAQAIAKRDNARIVPTGSYALYKLGLTTQVPLNAVYYTDASPRRVNIGKQHITFKKASARSLAASGQISRLAIQALRSIGKDAVREEEVEKIKELLKKENPHHLQHDLQLAPQWIRTLIGPLS